MSFLDRVNVGTAKLHGLQQDLNLTGNEFNIASLIFFVSYGEWGAENSPAKALCRNCGTGLAGWRWSCCNPL